MLGATWIPPRGGDGESTEDGLSFFQLGWGNKAQRLGSGAV